MTLKRMLFMITLAVAASAHAAAPRPILIQGALRLEVAHLIDRLEHVKTDTIGPWKFWRGTLDGVPVIVSKTRMGAAHAAAATALAIERYRPVAIIFQGTAGGTEPSVHNYDIIIGTSAISTSAFKTPRREAGTGSDSLQWIPTDLRETSEKTEDDLHEGTVERIPADPSLLAAARSVRASYTRGRVVDGVIASSEVWNQELDRIKKLHDAHGTSVEEFETAPAARIAALMHVPFIGIRVVTANETSSEAYDAKTADACQEFVISVVRAYARAKH